MGVTNFKREELTHSPTVGETVVRTAEDVCGAPTSNWRSTLRSRMVVDREKPLVTSLESEGIATVTSSERSRLEEGRSRPVTSSQPPHSNLLNKTVLGECLTHKTKCCCLPFNFVYYDPVMVSAMCSQQRRGLVTHTMSKCGGIHNFLCSPQRRCCRHNRDT